MNKIIKFKYLIILIILVFTINANSQLGTFSLLEDPVKQPVEMTVDIEHIKLELKIDPFKQIIQGVENVAFNTLRTNTDSLRFYGPDIDFKQVTINGNEAKFFKSGIETVVYDLGDLKYDTKYEMQIEFTGNPTDGLFFTGWNDPTKRMRRQIWAHSPQNWMPFINQKHDILTTEVIVTFDSKYKVYSNGNRIEEKVNNDGTTTWHYNIDKPHVIYLVCLVIGDFDYKITKSKAGVPMELWYYPDLAENFDVSYIHSEDMMDFLGVEIGVKYPWDSYKQVPLVNYMFGAMETTTSTVYGDFMYLPARAWWMRNYVNVNAHELTHQWFGNYLSHLNNRHTWLTESFATYYAKIYEKSIFGEDYYEWERDKELIRTFDAAKSNNNPVSHSYAGTNRWYPKGSLVIDMLRYVMGDTLFHTAMKYYVEKYAHQVVETNDLMKSIRESTGLALDWFFDEWILRGGEPHYKVDYSTYKDINNHSVTVVNIKQIHKINELIKYFKMPIEIQVYYKDNTFYKIKAMVEGANTTINIPNKENKEVSFVVFDPNRKIIKQLTFDRSDKELFAQAEFAENMIDRYDALLALRNIDLNNKRDLYYKLFKKEKFFLNKAEIIKQLASDSLSYNFLNQSILDNDVLVRRSIVENIKSVPLELKKNYENMLKDTCFTNTELALRNLSDSFSGDVAKYLEITKDEVGWRGKNIRMAWLEIAIMYNLGNQYIDELIDYSSLSFEFETRINALTTLQKLNIYNAQTIENAINAYLHWNYKLSSEGVNYLKYIYSQNKGKKLIKETIKKHNFTTKEQNKIDKLGF